MKRKQQKKDKMIEVGTRAWHDQQLRECLAIAQATTKQANDVLGDNLGKATFHQMQALQASMQAMVHGLLMLNPEMYVEESDKEEDS